MKSYNTLYYLLFVLLVMGAFASMAQNSYGLKILGGVSIAFGLVFLYQFFEKLGKKAGRDTNDSFELISLSILAFVFALRIFHVYFPFIEILFEAAGLLLIWVYLQKLISSYRKYNLKNMRLAILLSVYYLSIICFITSLVLAPFVLQFSAYIGGLAIVLLTGFILGSILTGEIILEGESLVALSLIARARDKSIILVSLFVLLACYIGFNRIGILPELYSDEYPQAYYEMVNKAESGKELPVNGTFRHEEFKAHYNQFIKKYIRVK